ncbi:sensor histidine kinase [Uliginosibacterium sp. H1]|uniref:sensor histidine kinase n=1 Tax=Uliginosibacterium sp. H1 TaxID=3114757 RepID=UPI002E17D74A|nr:ATP-binding protein [Uliginosibacterium sp. H1]
MQDEDYTQLGSPGDPLSRRRPAVQLSGDVRSPIRMAATIFGSYALVTLLMLLGVWALLAQDRAREFQRQETQIASLARALDELANRSFGQADNAASAIARSIVDHGQLDPSGIRHAEAVAGEWLLRQPFLRAITIGDAKGNKLVTVRQRQAPGNLDAPLSEFDPRRRNVGNRLGIGAPFKSQDERWYIPALRNAHDMQGERIGVVSLLIDVEHFEHFYRDIRLTAQDSIAILDTNGVVLLRLPVLDGLMGSEVHDSSPYDPDGNADAPRAITYSGSLNEDAEPRMAVFRRLADYPLRVVVSRPMSAAMADFEEMRRRLLFGTGTLISLLALMAWISYHDACQRELAREELGRVNATLEERVRRRTSELEQTNRELVAFSYTISHDLRAPLRAINGFAHALREDYGDRLDDQGREYLERVYRGSIRMGELIDELLSLANISRQPLSITTLNLSTIAEDISSELRTADPGREVLFDIQPGIQVEGDEVLLRNALYNLLHNAWKFTRSRRPAVITVSEQDDREHKRIIVADNGVGFDMAHAKRLFQPFQQLHARQGFGGTGIGLASVRRIIERHGGRIWVESVPDEGTQFSFTMPYRASVIRRRRRSLSQPQSGAQGS